MTERRPLIIPGFDHLLHGGDYNPDQWLSMPEVLEADSRLMELSGCNVFTIGVFSWTSYEPAEGQFSFDWLDRTMDRVHELGKKVVLATPSGAKPAWMAQKYPEIRRVDRNGQREPQMERHNHCWTSPVYRKKVALINQKLAQRYQGHPALGMWHLSNEYAGDCYCGLCLASFQGWLEKRYSTLDELNRAWYAAFWNHTFTAWNEIDPRDSSIDSLAIDFKRYYNDILIDFIQWEMKPLKELTPEVPCTTNFMGKHPANHYALVAEHLDLVADDQYPAFDGNDPHAWRSAVSYSFKDDLYRCFKPDRPWMLLESCPDAPQWLTPMRLKRPNVHMAEMLQAVAHGAEGTCYFQWRKGRGGVEKFHGAVVDHAGHENTRVFRCVQSVSAAYEKLEPVLGSTVRAKVAFVYDWEARWGLEHAAGPDIRNRAYDRMCEEHYLPFWQNGVSVDVLGSHRDFSGYRLLVTPQLFMLKPGVADRIRAFVDRGGTWVGTVYSGYTDQHNRCFLGGFPGGGLNDVLGIWNEEFDVLGDGVTRRVHRVRESLGLGETLVAREVCELLWLRGATTLASYDEDFYAGQPALTVNEFGRGRAYYHASRFDEATLLAFYTGLIEELGLPRHVPNGAPTGVLVQQRSSGSRHFLFLINFNTERVSVDIGPDRRTNVLSGGRIADSVELGPWESIVLCHES
jgi:beta-galactosidase